MISGTNLRSVIENDQLTEELGSMFQHAWPKVDKPNADEFMLYSVPYLQYAEVECVSDEHCFAQVVSEGSSFEDTEVLIFTNANTEMSNHIEALIKLDETCDCITL